MTSVTGFRSALRRAWDDGGCAVGAWALSPDPVPAEALARAGFSWICVDMQHGWLDFAALPGVVHAVASGGAAPVVRVPANELWMVGRALDAGAHGVMVPLVDDAAAAARAVASCRYAPGGRRSVGAIRPPAALAGAPRDADRELVCIVQIESRAALDQIDEICATPGLDAVYIGPGDLALSFGLGSAAENEESTLMAVAAAAGRHGIVAGMHGETGEQARWALERGFGMTTAGADIDFMYGAARSALTTALGGAPPAREPDPDQVPRVAV